MKQINFSHPGGFPLEQETLERLQTAYRAELFGALKAHLSIETDKNYIVAPATTATKGWAIIQQDENNLNNSPRALPETVGVLYPIQKGAPTGFLKTTRKGTNLVYGTGVSQTAYFDYEAEYISPEDYANRPDTSHNDNLLTVYYYDLRPFKIVKDLKTIELIIQTIEENIISIKTNIAAIENNIDAVEADIKNYLPLNGSKAMKGDLNLDIYKLSKLDTNEAAVANVRAIDFRLGSASKRGLRHQADPLGRALADNSDQTKTNLTLNYASDWENTTIGGKVYLDNLSASNATGSLLVIDNANQVTKSNTLLQSLIDRIKILEEKPATAVPIGMIALWGKTAPFPEGWEEYLPLRGRMPVGLDISQPEFNTMQGTGGAKNKLLTIDEIPAHTHTYDKAIKGRGYQTRSDDNPLSTNTSVTSGSAGGGQAFSILNPYRIVQFIEYTGRPADTTAPVNAPNLRVADVGRTFVALEWTPSYDERGITNYMIYKDNVLAATVGNVTSYAIDGLSRSRTYNFYVVATDAARNLGPTSNPVSAKTNLL
ncbi:hypothetical protein B0A67_10145 [Flavobacterium aquidurense]|jgi:hypothetical protein|uniref:fibronectin type III domain-containing protein n=1 Tax=Flavobacterium aquidurense TaxID=362413 RepID=UPI0009117ED7|nr:hypothetical protein [Flavobacterium aquidurense]OXA71709.1 hypothetical protein B0A67_10145 [Flavobacterium aquidurense]SHH19930.1 hypothetical protein SAMN05444481_11327 [Flavobacterium frigidimaris]